MGFEMMPGTDLLIAFFLATAVFAYMPGPAMLYATAQTLAGGARAGWFAALGIHIGGYAHVLAAAFGLALLFETVPVLYTVLKFGGAAYLVWLGIQMWRAPKSEEVAAPRRTTFRTSVMVEVLNPKTALFYLAFLPQFTDPAAALPIWAQLVVLGTVVNVMFSSADVACVLLAGRLSHYLRSGARRAMWLRRVGGTVLVGLGARLALDH